MSSLVNSRKRLSNRDLGRMGENAGARFLESRGYRILNRNWRCDAGEVDIVAQDDVYLIFVEVKTRRSCELGYPAEAVTPERRQRYERIATQYLRSHNLGFQSIRFDVLAIEVKPDETACIRHILNAFGGGQYD